MKQLELDLRPETEIFDDLARTILLEEWSLYNVVIGYMGEEKVFAQRQRIEELKARLAQMKENNVKRES